MRIFSWCDCYSPLIGRVIMGGIFLMSASTKALEYADTAVQLSKAGVPYPEYAGLLFVTIEALGGLALVVGYRTKLAASVLLVFTAGIALTFHTAAGLQNLMSTDLALIAGLLYIMTYGSGLVAIDNRKRTRK
jgi:putative oxidoreductase